MNHDEIKRKKQYLRAYRKHRQRADVIRAQLEEMNYLKGYREVMFSESGKTNSANDISDFIVKVEAKEEKLTQALNDLITAYDGIEHCINSLTDKDERDVLIYRYIKGLPYWDIGNTLFMSERWVYRLHGSALDHIVIDVKEERCNYEKP